MIRFNRFLLLSLLLTLALISACAGPVAPSGNASEDPIASDTVAEAPAAPTDEPTEEPTDEPTDEPTEEPTEESTVEPTEEPTEEPAATTGPITETLPAEYLQDSDGNVIPDFLESELGYDPATVDCGKECAEGVSGSELNLETNVLLLFDSSGSMAGAVGSERKIDIAKQAVERFMRVGSKGASVGLLVYGHKGNNTEAGKAESCPGVELLAPLGQATEDNAQELIGRFEPTGWTPIGGALEAAVQAFAGKEGQGNRIIVISDGEETCGGDPVAVAQRLNQEGFNVQVDVVGFDLENQAVVDQMQAIAAAGGGTYFDARSRDQLSDYLDGQLEALYKTREAWVCNINLGSVVLNCDQSQVTKAADWLRARAIELEDSDPQQSEALRALRDEIRDRFDLRTERYREAGRKSSELFEQIQQMRRELDNAN